ncbi:TPA: hypothetical protein EYG84_01910 [Candidatus Gracilibacteria bacterium]|nr:hypothetical protein [Candidatus Gracilibacteria bacterium]
MKRLKPIIIINCIMLLIALYTFISLYKPSILHFIDSDYVNGEYFPKGGDHLTDELFLGLFHYANLLAFSVLNIIFMIRSFIKKQTKGILISAISIVLMLGINFWINSTTNNNPIEIEETYYKKEK